MNQNNENYISSHYNYLNEETLQVVPEFEELNNILEEIYSDIANIENRDLTEASEEVIDIMNNEEIKNHPFFLFLPSMDLTWSVLSKIPHDDKVEVVIEIIKKYITLRYVHYNDNETMAVLSLLAKDRGSSRKNGESARRKVESMVSGVFTKTGSNSYASMSNNEYALTDKDGKNLYLSIVDSLAGRPQPEINKLKSKKPDFLFKVNNELILIEHKHMKEMGGAQDKQLLEVLSFIESFLVNNIDLKPYGFIDGIYYNRILKTYNEVTENGYPTKKNKIHQAVERIKAVEDRYGYCPILNTAAFSELIGL